MINDNKTTTIKLIKYKTKIIGRTSNNNNNNNNNNNRLNAEVVVSLKYLSKFWRSLDLLLINCEIELELTWTKKWVISQVSRTVRAVDPNADPVEYEVEKATTGATFQINNAEPYVLVVTLSMNDNIKFLENIKQGFERKSSWNKYRSEMTT